MRGASFAAAFSLFFFAAGFSLAAETPRDRDSAPADAERLVTAALRSEAKGQNAERQRLLHCALRIAPDHAPARWQSGYVHLDGTWQRSEDVATATAADPLRQEYYELRKRFRDNAAGNLRLGLWCQDHKLAEESRAHLLRVIALDPDNMQARGALGYRRVRGLWLTQAELKEYQDQEQQQRKMDARWKPVIESIRRRLEHPAKAVRQAAADELLAIRDTEAIYSLERHLAGASKQGDELLAQVFGNMPGHEATLALTRLAVFSPSRDARTAAADSLKACELETYAPLLLAGLYKPIELHHEFRGGGGMVLWRRTLVSERQYSVHKAVDNAIAIEVPTEVIYMPGIYINRLPRWGDLSMPVGGNRIRIAPSGVTPAPAESTTSLTLRAFWLEEEVRIDSRQRNERITAVLNHVTDQQLDTEPATWWTWWNDRYDVAVYEKVPRTTYGCTVSRVYTGPSLVNITPWASCFAVGTPVQTVTGCRPIERLQVGDLVLSQDVETGELAYKPVLQTTARPPVPLVNLTIGDETVRCTPGHAFWVDGTGWVPARELAEGSYLHGIRGASPLWTRSECPRERTYNLVVADFGTYFVGRQAILVHDISIWQPTDAAVPGLAR